MTNLRSEDWAVRPSFVPNGPTSPVVLLADETASRSWLAFRPSPGRRRGVRSPTSSWCASPTRWRSSPPSAAFVTAGAIATSTTTKRCAPGARARRRRHPAPPACGRLAVVAVVVLASFAGGIAAWFNRGSHAASELSDAKFVNLTLNDLPSGWYSTSNAVLNYLVAPAGQVYTFNTSTTTTAAGAELFLRQSGATIFQTCIGVSQRNDRVYGAAGQEPDFKSPRPSSLPTHSTASNSPRRRSTTTRPRWWKRTRTRCQ